MAQRTSPLGQFFIDNAKLSVDEIRERVTEAFPDVDFSSEKGKKNFWNYRARANNLLTKGVARPYGKNAPKKKPGAKKKPAAKPVKKKPKGSPPARSPEAFDPLETPDAKILMSAMLRVGFNTAEAVFNRFKHIIENQR